MDTPSPPIGIDDFQTWLGMPVSVHGTPSERMLAFFVRDHKNLRDLAGRVVVLHGHQLVWCVGIAEDDDDDVYLIVEEAGGRHTRVWVSCVGANPLPLTGLAPDILSVVHEAFGHDPDQPRPFLVVSRLTPRTP